MQRSICTILVFCLTVVVYLACFFFGVFPNVWVMAVTFPAFLMIPGATYFAWGKARDIRRKELEQAQAENADKSPPQAANMNPIPVVHIQETRVEVEESGCVRATRADVESAPDEVDRVGADGASRKSSKDELFRRPSSSFSLTGPMNLSPYRPRHDSSSSESESNGRRGDRRVMEGLVEAGERQREEDEEVERDAEASIPKDQMKGMLRDSLKRQQRGNGSQIPHQDTIKVPDPGGGGGHQPMERRRSCPQTGEIYSFSSTRSRHVEHDRHNGRPHSHYEDELRHHHHRRDSDRDRDRDRHYRHRDRDRFGGGGGGGHSKVRFKTGRRR